MKTLICLLVAVGVCVAICIVLEKLEVLDEVPLNTRRLDIAPHPNEHGLITYSYKKYESVERWTGKIVEFLKREFFTCVGMTR